jgi:hypothetical protein
VSDEVAAAWTLLLPQEIPYSRSSESSLRTRTSQRQAHDVQRPIKLLALTNDGRIAVGDISRVGILMPKIESWGIINP